MSEELYKVGIDVIEFEFSAEGYVLKLRLNFLKTTGWEELEYLPVIGLVLAKTRDIDVYMKKALYVPSNSKEFKDYVIKHQKCFGLGKQKALSDLQETVEKYCGKNVVVELAAYIKRSGK